MDPIVRGESAANADSPPSRADTACRSRIPRRSNLSRIKMTPEELVDSFLIVESSALAGILKAMRCPPGRQLAGELVRISWLYRKLSYDDKQALEHALRVSARATLNNILGVLDG